MLKALANPFRKFYFEEYIQTVIGSETSKFVYNWLVHVLKPKINQAYDYTILSKFFEWAAKLGGVSMN